MEMLNIVCMFVYHVCKCVHQVSQTLQLPLDYLPNKNIFDLKH